MSPDEEKEQQDDPAIEEAPAEAASAEAAPAEAASAEAAPAEAAPAEAAVATAPAGERDAVLSSGKCAHSGLESLREDGDETSTLQRGCRPDVRQQSSPATTPDDRRARRRIRQ